MQQPSPLKICFIGGGNMGAAIVGGLAKQNRPDWQLHVIDPSADKRAHLATQFGASTAAAVNADDIQAADILVLAIKPQQLPALAATLAPMLDRQLVISIAAGVRTGVLSGWLGGFNRLVWVMPNTPAQVLQGVSGIYATEAVSAAEKVIVGDLFGAIGSVFWVDQESKMDAVTAISGCGPAYVFYFVEALEEAAQSLGFDPETARKMAIGTFGGALSLLGATGEAPAVLRDRVTSKKGVTERGIQAMETDQIKALVAKATQVALARSVELGDALAAGAQA